MSVQTHFALRAPTPLPIALLDLPGHTELHLIQFVLSGEHQIRFLLKPGLPGLPLPGAAQRPATTYNYCMIAVLWDAFDRGVLDFMSRLSNCSASAPSLIEMTPPCSLKVLKGRQLQGIAAILQLRARDNTCKRRCTPMPWYSPPKDNAIGVYWRVFLQQPWQEWSIREPSAHHCYNQRRLNTPENVFWSKHNWTMMKTWLS